MCGIVGWVDFTRDLTAWEEVISSMTSRLTPRGPDACGYWRSQHVFFGHRRLVVVDPEGGGQPMIRQKDEKKYVLVYNGELYNTPDLRRELLSLGYTFQGWSDTEVLLNSYLEWGENCPRKLNGIFAFAVWDENKEQLFLCRDRVGIKPLFYSQRGPSFLFASEIKALLAHPLVKPKVDREGLAEIFVMGPARTPGHGVFSQISELKPGYSMIVDRRGTRLKRYWSLESIPHRETWAETSGSVRELVVDAVKRQLVSDVPLCTLLSGGLDSSIITAIAAKAYQEAGFEAIRTFSVDYTGNKEHFQSNEFQPDPDAPWVEKVSSYYGTRHTICLIDTPKLAAALLPAVTARDLQGRAEVDSSFYLFSCEIKKQATVGLSGEGADEVFGGYPWFYRHEPAHWPTFPWMRRVQERSRFYTPELLAAVDPREYMTWRYREALEEVPRFPEDTPENARMREMFYINITRWMPTLLDRKDRMSMAAGLELRVPYCDHRLMEYLWNIPWEMKYYKQREKGLLRLAFEDLLPPDVLWRKKSPYPKTHNPAYLEIIRNWMLRLLEDRDSPLLPLVKKKELREYALAVKPETNIPWFGQLMNAPQLLAYFIQVDYWLREYKVDISLT